MSDTSRTQFTEKIRNKLLVKILITASAILLALAVTIYLVNRSILSDELERKSTYKLNLAASTINAWLEEKAQVLRTLIESESIKTSNRRRQQAIFKKMAATYAAKSIYLGLRNRQFITGSGWRAPPDYDPRARPWYIQASQQKRLIFTKPYVDAMTKKLVITIATPYLVRGVQQGVLAMDILIDSVVASIGKLKIGKKGHGYLVDRDGTYITHRDKTKILQQKIESETVSDSFSEVSKQRLKSKIVSADEYLMFSRIDATGWYIVFHIPFSEVNRPMAKMLYTFLLGFAMSVLILSLLVSYISKLIARPILDLAFGAEKVSDGDYETEVPVSSRDEIGYLAYSFNEMTGGLKDRDFIKSTFGRYVSPSIMNDILNGNINLGGEKKTITILFADIRSFTQMSEKMDPHVLVNLLNEYFTFWDESISAHKGSINKFLGDGIMAIFGAPEELDNSPLAAIRAAEAATRRLGAFNQARETSLRIGIGIHTGEAVVGNIGSAERTEYTVIGDSVNLASRIESISKLYGETLLISGESAQGILDSHYLRFIDKVRVKGKALPVDIYSPAAKADTSAAEIAYIEFSNEVLRLYEEGDFVSAADMLASRDDLNKHLSLIKERCTSFATNPPNDWDGVYTALSK